MVLFWKERDDTAASKALVSNRLTWEVIRMMVVYRHRWTGTETFHRDRKQELGLGDCQGRHGKGQTRHGYLVSAAYSLLMRSLHQTRPQAWARTRLTTIGEACRAIKGELLGQLVDWIIDKLAGLDHRVSHLVLKTTEKTPRLIPRGRASRELPRPPEPSTAHLVGTAVEEGAMATISQAQHRRQHDRHPRWTRLARADLLARHSALHPQGLAQRPAAKVREGPRTLLQVWRASHEPLAERPTVVACLHSVPGLACLQRWGMAFQAGCVARGACGLRLVCLGLEWPGRKRFGGTSYGPQPQGNRHVAEASVAYRPEERRRRSHEMPRKDSTLTPDAILTGGLCLVGIAPVSNAMVLAQAAQARAHAPWQACLELALVGCTWQGSQAPSDEAPSLLWRLWHSPSGRLTRRTSSLGSCGRTPRGPLLIGHRLDDVLHGLCRKVAFSGYPRKAGQAGIGQVR